MDRETGGPDDKDGSTPDVAAIFVANHRAFLAFLERRVGSRAAAEDILQEAFVRGIGKVKAESDQSVIAWFYQSLRNAAIDYHRRHQSATKALDAFASETADHVEPDDDLRDAVCQCVRGLADTIKPELATAIKRIEVDGLAVKDYAAEVGITPGNAAVRVFRAREALRKQVARSCGSCAEHGCLDCTCGARPSQAQSGTGP
jgi:RNA polymerase sigma-70 factor (ECF subfamily)